MVQGILVDEGDQTDHEGDTAVPALYVGVPALHQQHVQQVVAELPVRHVPQHARERAVADVVDARPRAVLEQVAGDVEHVPLVPRLRVVVVAVPPLLQRVADDESVERRVAQTVGLIDQVSQSVIHQKFQSLKSVLRRLFTLEQKNMESSHQLS